VDGSVILGCLPAPQALRVLSQHTSNGATPSGNAVAAIDEKQAAANANIIPLAAGKKAAHSSTNAYVCENGACAMPAETPKEFILRLRP